MVYQRQPGDAILSGQIDGWKVGNAILQLLPALPHETNFLPLPVPRGVARQMFQQPTTLLATQLIPPAAIAAQPAPAPVDARGNSIARTQAMPQPAANQVTPHQPNQVRNQLQPQPAPAGYRSAISGNSAIQTKSQRIRLAERSRGM